MYATIDPGITCVACALWSDADCVLKGMVSRWIKGKTLMDKCADMAQVVEVLKEKDVHSVWIEHPMYFDTPKGAMVSRKGDLVALVYAAGFLAGMLHVSGITVHCLPVNEWKGQLNKKQTRYRMETLHRKNQDMFGGVGPVAALNEHLVDAIAMGFYLKGYFK